MKSQSEQNKEINVFFLRKELDWEKKKKQHSKVYHFRIYGTFM